MIIRHTPWGEVQTQREMAEGIMLVSTAGHGGFVLSDARLSAMPERFKLNVYGRGRYFEEDCEYALVVAAFPHLFNAGMVENAHGTIKTFYPTLIV